MEYHWDVRNVGWLNSVTEVPKRVEKWVDRKDIWRISDEKFCKSPTRWTWVWVDSRSWWWTGRPGVLWFMGSQGVGHDWATELTELNWTSQDHVWRMASIMTPLESGGKASLTEVPNLFPVCLVAGDWKTFCNRVKKKRRRRRVECRIQE